MVEVPWVGVRSEGGYLQHRLPAHTRPHVISWDANTWMHIILHTRTEQTRTDTHVKRETDVHVCTHVTQHEHAVASYPLTTITTLHPRWFASCKITGVHQSFGSHKTLKEFVFSLKSPFEPSRRLQSIALCHSWNLRVLYSRKLMVIQEETRRNR